MVSLKHYKYCSVCTSMTCVWLNAINYRVEDLEKELDGERKVKVQLMQDVKELEMKLEEK